jgi:hypothetical protein
VCVVVVGGGPRAGSAARICWCSRCSATRRQCCPRTAPAERSPAAPRGPTPGGIHIGGAACVTRHHPAWSGPCCRNTGPRWALFGTDGGRAQSPWSCSSPTSRPRSWPWYLAATGAVALEAGGVRHAHANRGESTFGDRLLNAELTSEDHFAQVKPGYPLSVV